MKVTVLEESPSKKTMEVVVESTKLEGAYSKAFKKVLKQFAMPGFRKGKVPAKLAKKYITDEGLAGEVLEDIIPQAYKEALDQENLSPISEPAWDIVQKDRGSDLIFKVSFEVVPVLELSDYKGIEITQERDEITGKDVEETIDNIRKGQAQVVPVEEDRGLQEGDLAVVDYRSTKEGEELEGGSVDNYLMELKQDFFIPGFVDQLLGLKANDEKTFDIDFPEDYDNKDLAGEKVTFEFKIKEIKERKLPEADDDFASSVSDHDTIAEFRQHIETRLKENIEQRARELAAAQIFKALLEQVPNEKVPQALHHHRANIEIRKTLQELAHRGIQLESWLQQRGIDQQQWINEMAAAGMFEARIELIVGSIAAAENIEVTNEDIDPLIENEAKSRRIKPAKLRDQMRDEGSLDMLKYNILRGKVQDFLLDSADINYVKPGEAGEDSEKKKSSKKKADADKPASKKEENQEETKPKKTKKSSSKTKKTEKADDDSGKDKEKTSKSKSKAKSKKTKEKAETKTKSSAKPKKKAKSKKKTES